MAKFKEKIWHIYFHMIREHDDFLSLYSQITLSATPFKTEKTAIPILLNQP